MDVVIVGVGGQGILTASNILARASMKAGLNIVMSEVHGMAQRGGSVEVHVRIGDVLSPLIPLGSADIMIALEPVEALRYSKYLNERSVVVINDRPIVPMTVSLGLARYPTMDEIVEALEAITPNIVMIGASAVAEKLGAIQATNVVMLGAISALLPFDFELLEDGVREVLPPKLHDLNIKALRTGRKLYTSNV